MNAIDKDDLLNNLLYFRKKLPKLFFNFDTSFFLSNLFKFKNKFIKKNKKLLYFSISHIILNLIYLEKVN